jgi:large subunit ribosomal protein L3
MAIGILGRKVGMTQIFDAEGNQIGVTVIEAGPCPVIQKKTVASDQYNAIQLGFVDKKEKRVNKPELGHFKKAQTGPKRYLKELRLEPDEIVDYSKGDEIKVNIFKSGERVDVIGWSKGRGFAGVVKRHHFAGFPASHGTHEYFRHGGAIGCRTSPGRIFKGKRMPGRMGNERKTIQNLQIIGIQEDQNLLLLKGAIPGSTGTLVIVRKAVKARK